MGYKDTNKVTNWRLYVFEQKKTENAVIMNTSMSGRKKEDGTYDKGMNVKVVVCSTTNWPRVDFTGKVILVNGSFQHKWWEQNGRSGIDISVFADDVKEYVKDEPKEESPDWN